MAFTKILGPGIGDGNQVIVGIITATKFVGDGSALSGISAGLGSDASGNDSGFYYTNAIGYITENTTVSSPDPTLAPVIFTKYDEVVVVDGADFTIGEGNELLLDVLNLNQLTIL
jgi:hypothetical protein